MNRLLLMMIVVVVAAVVCGRHACWSTCPNHRIRLAGLTVQTHHLLVLLLAAYAGVPGVLTWALCRQQQR